MTSGGKLAEIIAAKRRDVEARLGSSSLEDLRARARPTRLSLGRSLSRPGCRFILEFKRSSPSEGELRRSADPAAIARSLGGIADAMSVLLDEPFFGGSFKDLDAVRSNFDGPVLAKDFLVDPRQVPEARLRGADAILVMLSVLGDEEARAMIDEAGRLAMDALVEVHDETELNRALALGAEIIGINNRDLKTFAVDLEVTERLAPLVPPGVLVVSESGIRCRGDIERLGTHADAFLVGSAIMKAENPGHRARELVFGRVKLCGMTNARDLENGIASGAIYAGLVLVPGTPRAVTLAKARQIVRDAASPASIVGVFRDAKLMEVAFAAHELQLSAVQLHGSEPAAYVLGLKPSLPPGCEIWAASAVSDFVPGPRHGADRTLFDTRVGTRSGGTGRRFDWALVEGTPELATGLLAGGINPANIGEASRLGAFALDVGSGVEARPGCKDPGKLAQLFGALRPASRKELVSC
ncbi:MAG: bifunctional indole-3-glycerol-phosphate synthase TrpC/phosphoribosylanthranilate isomerase TrpF [Sphingomonas sp.]|nr:bifunctional indole-3-glycerol-phosphate synthase TrpC/phosphoribosylanthranilate isomerase TrpF [Sphingomonas sp.]